MKKVILISLITLLFINSANSQEQVKTLDYIFLKDGNTIETRIIRANNRKIYYTHPETFQITEVDMDEVKDYEYNDEYFYTNDLGELEHSEVVYLESYRKDEIYRAILDWFIVNSRHTENGIVLEDNEYFIILGRISTPNYLKMDFATVMSLIDDNPNSYVSYSFNYDVNIRVKDNRFKIYINNFRIQNNALVYDKLLTRAYDKRKLKDGTTTIHMREITDIKNMIREQIDNIRNHCEDVRKFDTFHSRVIKAALVDDDW